MSIAVVRLYSWKAVKLRLACYGLAYTNPGVSKFPGDPQSLLDTKVQRSLDTSTQHTFAAKAVAISPMV